MRGSSRTSSAQLELKLSKAPIVDQAGTELTRHTAQQASQRPADPAAEASALVSFPNFDRAPSVYAQTARIAGRINASHVSEEEIQRLLVERQRLLDKRFAKTISRREENQLQYVLWSLDRIDDARHGHELEALEGAISEYEKFGDDVRQLSAQLQSYLRKKK